MIDVAAASAKYKKKRKKKTGRGVTLKYKIQNKNVTLKKGWREESRRAGDGIYL